MCVGCAKGTEILREAYSDSACDIERQQAVITPDTSAFLPEVIYGK